MKDKEIKILAEKQAQENISKKNHFSTCISLRKRVPELDSTTTSSAAPSLSLGIEGREGAALLVVVESSSGTLFLKEIQVEK